MWPGERASFWVLSGWWRQRRALKEDRTAYAKARTWEITGQSAGQLGWQECGTVALDGEWSRGLTFTKPHVGGSLSTGLGAKNCEGRGLGRAKGQPGDDFAEKREGENRDRKPKMACRERRGRRGAGDQTRPEDQIFSVLRQT